MFYDWSVFLFYNVINGPFATNKQIDYIDL